MVRHHLDSYDDFLFTRIPGLLKASNPLTLQLGDERIIRVYFGGKGGDEIDYKPPRDDAGTSIVPHMCRLDRRTYSLDMEVKVVIETTVGKETKTEEIPSFLLGQIPLMLRSRPCYLTQLEPSEAFDMGECHFELGGYFIIGGSERVLLTQELLGNNMYYTGKRKNVSSSSIGKPTLVEHAPAFKVDSPEYETETEVYAAIRSISEDGATGPFSHFMIIPPRTKYRRKRLALIQLPGYDQPVPLIAVFEALGVVTDKDLYDVILAGVPEQERTVYDDILTELILSFQVFRDTKTSAELLASRTRTQSLSQVIESLHTTLFPHVESRGDDAAGLFRRKAYTLGHLTRMALDLTLDKTGPSDREHFKYKRLNSSGDLYFQEFKRIYRELARKMLTLMDKRLTYEASTYAGAKLADLIQPETIGAFWATREVLKTFEKSHKSQWGGQDGVSQELSRLSYYSTLSQLRRISLQMDKTLNIAEPRRLHCSQYGLVCPIDSPDGKSIGFIKSFTTLARLATPSLSSKVYDLISSKGLLPLAMIHPAVWNPSWTRLFLNADLVGVIPVNTEAFHKQMMKDRREGLIDTFVSLSWNRLDNVYTIFTDSGRPIRPVYREGTTPKDVMSAKTWQTSESLFDWIDASETENTRLSMLPFHPKLSSEIHPSFNYAPSSAGVPFSDHNAGTRNMFSAAQQQKQAVGWYNTNFKKRFDTIASILNAPQRPIAQNWIYQHAFGCMPYGQNVVVAIMVYGGFNQEDSVLVNRGSLKRGLFDTTYFHSYKYEEEVIDSALQSHTQAVNLTLDKWADVKRKPDADYSKLDADGIIKEGSDVDPTTVLVGFVSPIANPDGIVQSYRDVSILPKRGQRGRVDAVYRYRTPDGLLGIQIRLAERRTPTLGDKFASRHGQKGTIGAIVEEEDMPFNRKGVRPDIIVNPHAIPTRMTVGQLLESTCNKIAVKQGALTDGTPFTVSNRIPDTAKLMVQLGFESYGSEMLYSGQTGEMIDTPIFIGPTFYMRLKQMVEDKINYRDTGARQSMTHQPPEGRSNDGGLRIGEMERDVLLAHGVSSFAQESMMKRSDGTTVVYQPETGRLDADTEHEQRELEIPYTMRLFMQEIQAMHVNVKVVTDASA